MRPHESYQIAGEPAKYLAHNAQKDVSRRMNIKPNPGVQTLMISDDMLDFVSQMKTGSGNFILNGIDWCIVKLPEYHQALAQEMARATIPGGIICGVNFKAYETLLKTEGMELILPINPRFDFEGKIESDQVVPVVFRKAIETKEAEIN